MKLKNLLLFITLTTLLIFSTSCKQNKKIIKVCASELPHADILENCVAPLLDKEGYTLKVYVLDWTLQNEAVASKDYDANYFQHIPYLETYEGNTPLFATCKVHYEPLGIYQGKNNLALEEGKTFAICNDESNAIRALELLYEKNIIDELPVVNDKLTFSSSKWTSSNGIKVTLIEESLLVATMADYDFVCLPSNTAYTGNVSNDRRVAQEDNQDLITQKANVLAARLDDYNSSLDYKAKIDVLTNALLSEEVANYILTKYDGSIICNQYSQIDLRN